MKSLRIIYILFLLFCIHVNATIDRGGIPAIYSQSQADSIYSFNKQLEQQRNAEAIINWYTNERKETELSIEDVEKLAVSHAILDDESNALTYMVKHIKESHSIDILNNTAFQRFRGSPGYDTIRDTYVPRLNGWILFFFSIGLIGVFISIVLNLRKKGDTVANVLISSFVLLHSLFVLYVCLFLSNYIYEFPEVLRVTTAFSFLYGPLLYFYFKRISERYEFRWIDALHLTPTVILVFVSMPIYLSSFDEKLHLLYNKELLLQDNLNVIIILKSLSLLIYGLLVYKIYKRSLKKKQKSNLEILKWEKNILILNSIYVVSYLFYGAALMSMTADVFRYPLIFALCIIVLYVAYTAYVQPKVFSKNFLFAGDLHKYQKSGLTESFSHDLKNQLIQLLNEEKVYKINNINLEVLANKLGTTRHNISQVINEHFDVNFFNLINKYRIREAQQIFEEDWQKNLHIIDVAYEVGFNNKVTFNKAFKEETKLTPTQFLLRIHNKKDLATSA